MQTKNIVKNNQDDDLNDKKIISIIVRGHMDEILEIKNQTIRKKVKITSIWYTSVVVFFIVLSLILLQFNIDQLITHKYIFSIIEICAFVVLLIDYLLRWYTANIQLEHGKLSYVIYPFRFIPLLLLTSLVPTFYVINMFIGDHNHPIWVILGVLKLSRIVRILMAASLFPSLKVIRQVIQKSKNWISIAFLSIIVTILLFALAIEASEQTFFQTNPNILPKNTHGIVQGYWSAVYYCVIAITTIGFGDIQVYSSLARVLTAIMAFIGIIIITIPSGILGGTFMSEIRDNKAKNAQKEIQEKYDSLLLKLEAVEQKEFELTKEQSQARENITSSIKYKKVKPQEQHQTKLIKNKRR